MFKEIGSVFSFLTIIPSSNSTLDETAKYMYLFPVVGIIIGILVAFSGTLLYIIRNLMVKVEKYEDVTVDQTRYLQNISNIIGESKQHLQNLDENGVFQSDDEVGEFFNHMKYVQDELNKYMLPENYGKEEIES